MMAMSLGFRNGSRDFSGVREEERVHSSPRSTAGIDRGRGEILETGSRERRRRHRAVRGHFAERRAQTCGSREFPRHRRGNRHDVLVGSTTVRLRRNAGAVFRGATDAGRWDVVPLDGRVRRRDPGR